MIEVKEITKKFGSHVAVDTVSFLVPQGVIFGVLGPNGAGKTTLIKLLLGLISPTKGEIFFPFNEGKNILNQIGYLPEERGLYKSSTVYDVLNYFGKLKSVDNNSIDAKIDEWLERFDILNLKKSTIGKLSKGNQQKIQFITCFLHNPQLIILDEPFSGFDPIVQELSSKIIEEERKKGKYIIISTHIMDHAENICDDVLFLNEGKNIACGKTKGLISNEDNIFSIKLNNVADKIIFEDKTIKLNSDSSFLIDLEDKNISDFLSRFSEEYDVTEFKKVQNSLHKVFLKLVNKN